MEADINTTSMHKCDCRCDPLKQIWHWFLHNLLKDHNVSCSELSKLDGFYKTSVFRNLARPSGVKLDCVITLETILLVGEWLSNVILKECSRSSSSSSKKGRHIVCKEDVKELIENFQSQVTKEMTGAWALPSPYVTSVTYEDSLGNARLSLNTRELIGPVIREAGHRGWNKDISYNCYHNRKYQVQIVLTYRAPTDDEHSFSWQDYRKLIVAQGIAKVLSILGHQVDERHYTTILKNGRISEDECSNSLIIIGKDITKLENGKMARLVSEPEVVLRYRLGEITSGSLSLHGLINERLEKISDSVRSEAELSSHLTSAQNLAKATLHYDLLKKALYERVHLCPLETKRESHHALFIMYNYARVLSILKRFNEQVEKLEYPALPELANIDFNGICEKEEEIQLLQLLLEWPRILDSAINFTRFELNLQVIPKFLLTLARAFNNFYFEVVVLVPPNAPHNFPMMMARLYLVKGICNVFQDCFDILQLAHSGT